MLLTEICQDLILVIFDYLPVLDQGRLGQVCQCLAILAREVLAKTEVIRFRSDTTDRRFVRSCFGAARPALRDLSVPLADTLQAQQLGVQFTDRIHHTAILTTWITRSCSNLVRLDLSGRGPFLQDCLGPITQSCKQLESLIFNARPTQMKELIRLEPAGMVALPALTELDLSGVLLCIPILFNILYKVVYSKPTAVRKLKTLILQDCGDIGFVNSFNGGTSALIYEMGPCLQKLDLAHCLNLSNEGISNVAKSCVNLTHIDLSALTHQSLTEIDDATIRCVIDHCKSLEIISIAGCSAITDMGLVSLHSNARHLRELDISGCLRLTSMTLMYLADHPTLEKLIFNEVPRGVYPAGAVAISSLRRLRELELGGSTGGMGLLDVVEMLSRHSMLQRLSLSWCAVATISLIDIVMKNNAALRYVDVSCCQRIGEQDYQLLRATYSACEFRWEEILKWI